MKVFLDMVGCRLNQAEIEQMARQFRLAGHVLVATPAEADVAVVNTCSVTAAAASDSRHKIRQAAAAGAGQVVVTGCWSTLSPQQAAELPAVSRVVPNAEKDRLVPDLLQIELPEFESEPVEREPIPGARLRTRAFLKVQDGCDNHCTFCITTVARGAGRSRSIVEVLEDVQAALLNAPDGQGGAREIVLTGVHLGSWGQDFAAPMHLNALIGAILEYSDVPRLRLSSLEPWDLDESFFRLWENPRLCRQLHLPLQSGSAATLRRMARKTTPAEFRRLVQSARQAIPGVAITTDLIAGFPGEGESEFAETLAFVDEMQFADGHVFTYSARLGTAAARLPGQVPHSVRKERNARLRLALEGSNHCYRETHLGQVLPVLWESAVSLGPLGWEMSGLTDNYLRVQAAAPRQLWNRITPVRLTALVDGRMDGKLVGQEVV
jgi:threonylcarbamoyladenosine tRNA methylthiotransferase MtaB